MVDKDKILLVLINLLTLRKSREVFLIFKSMKYFYFYSYFLNLFLETPHLTYLLETNFVIFF